MIGPKRLVGRLRVGGLRYATVMANPVRANPTVRGIRIVLRTIPLHRPAVVTEELFRSLLVPTVGMSWQECAADACRHRKLWNLKDGTCAVQSTMVWLHVFMEERRKDAFHTIRQVKVGEQRTTVEMVMTYQSDWEEQTLEISSVFSVKEGYQCCISRVFCQIYTHASYYLVLTYLLSHLVHGFMS